MTNQVSAGLALAVHGLHQDQVTAEVARAFIRRRCDPILLKGRVLAGWLYGEHEDRPSGDVDLLVDPALWEVASSELRALGFEPGQRGWQDVSRAFARPADGAKVDLHRSLFGLEAPQSEVWAALSRETVPLELAGVAVPTLSVAGRAMHLATHVAQHGYETNEKPLEDLRRGCDQLGPETWRRAADLAHELEAMAAFGAGLRLCDEGVVVSERLGLADVRSPAVELHAKGAPPLVLGLESLAESRSQRERLGFTARKLFPAPSYMRRVSRLAASGPPGLGLAYLARPLLLALRLPGALIAWRAARASAEREQDPDDQRVAEPQERT